MLRWTSTSTINNSLLIDIGTGANLNNKLNWHNQQSQYQNNFLGAPRNPISVRNYSQTTAAEVTTAAKQGIKHIQPRPADKVPKRNSETTSKDPTVAKNCSSVALVTPKTHCGESSTALQKTAIKQLKSKLPEPVQKSQFTATVNIVTQHEKPFHPTAGVVHVDRKNIPDNSTTKTEKENSSRNEVKYCFGCSFCAMRYKNYINSCHFQKNIQSLCFQPLNKNFVPPPLRMVSLPEYPVPARVFEITSGSEPSMEFK